MDYRDALLWLDQVQGRGIKLGLENIARLLDAMDRPQDGFVSVAVAGTNGKGSVSAFLSSIMQRAGLRAGLYTSPHLVRYEERIAVGGVPVDAARFAAAIGLVQEKIETLLESIGLDSHPTHFEILTAAALAHFRAARVDVAVLEVGMGGRLDAVRAAPARVSVITTIGLEHTQFLGPTLEAIAAEKAGIIRPGQTVISGVEHPGAAEVIRGKAAACGARLIELRRDARFERDSRVGPAGSPLRGTASTDAPRQPESFTLVTPRARYEGLAPSLAGRHQADNAALAILAAEALDEMSVLPAPVTREAIVTGIAQARWPGRLQIVGREPLFLLDGAHNPAGCAALARTVDELRQRGAFQRLCLIFGVLKDKEAPAMAQEIFPRAQRIILTRGRSERFRDPHDLAREIGSTGPGAARIASPVPVVAEELDAAIAAARAWCGATDAILLCGSLYLVGDALEALKIDPFPRALSVSEA